MIKREGRDWIDREEGRDGLEREKGRKLNIGGKGWPREGERKVGKDKREGMGQKRRKEGR